MLGSHTNPTRGHMSRANDADTESSMSESSTTSTAVIAKVIMKRGMSLNLPKEVLDQLLEGNHDPMDNVSDQEFEVLPHGRLEQEEHKRRKTAEPATKPY